MNLKGVFLDTNIFESAKFVYTSGYIKKLFDICDKFDLEIYIDEIVKNEVYNRIKIKSKDILNGINNKNLQYIANISNLPTKVEDVRISIENNLKGNFDSLIDNKITIIPSEYNHSKLLEMYFTITKPFELKKKHEFPDAIIALSIQEYSLKYDENIILISNDNGLIDFCDNNNMISAKQASEAIDFINQKFQMNEMYERHKDKLENELIDLIGEHDEILVFNIDGYVFDEEITAESYIINNVDINDIYLIDSDDENKVMTISCNTEIDFTITTEPYLDYENAIYDKDDHNFITFSKIASTFNYKESIELEFEVIIENFAEGDFYISYIGNDIDINFNEFDIDHTNNSVVEHILEYR